MDNGNGGRSLAAPLEVHHANIRHQDNGDGASAGEPGMTTASEDWLVPLLLVSMLEGNVYGGQLKSRVEELGFELSRSGMMYRALHTMDQEGLVVSEHVGDEVLLSRWRFGLTEAGEVYLEFWAHSLAQYRKELDEFLRIYEALNVSQSSGELDRKFEVLEVEANGHSKKSPVESQRKSRSRLSQSQGTSLGNWHDFWRLPRTNVKVFFLARHGLRSLSRSGEPFLGYEARDLFWRDMFGLIHEEDLTTLNDGISSIIERPGSSMSVEVRMLDTSEAWQWIEASVQNVLESPGDTGLLVVNLREHSSVHETEKPPQPVRPSYRDALKGLFPSGARGNGAG
ncbi:MAG: helix-turn-helix transcriptional regulator [Rubrobacter sp.]|nr:helix-turn-helix transcriptional regulator [Rubrobacter sp.]